MTNKIQYHIFNYNIMKIVFFVFGLNFRPKPKAIYERMAIHHSPFYRMHVINYASSFQIYFFTDQNNQFQTYDEKLKRTSHVYLPIFDVEITCL